VRTVLSRSVKARATSDTDVVDAALNGIAACGRGEGGIFGEGGALRHARGFVGVKLVCGHAVFYS
jgi:hypothetical protein